VNNFSTASKSRKMIKQRDSPGNMIRVLLDTTPSQLRLTEVNLINLTNFAIIGDMKTSANVYDMKTNYSKYLDLVKQGHEIKLMKNNKIVALMVPYKKPDRVPGKYDNLGYTIAEDFDEPDYDLIEALEKPIDI
jgi:antitoxin (DNA-binding transcriptional repressor) of toxin-antitoxin stability system